MTMIWCVSLFFILSNSNICFSQIVKLRTNVKEFKVVLITLDSLLFEGVVEVVSDLPIPVKVGAELDASTRVKEIEIFKVKGKTTVKPYSRTFDVPFAISLPWKSVLSLLRNDEDKWKITISGKVSINLYGVVISASFQKEEEIPTLRVPDVSISDIRIQQFDTSGLKTRLLLKIKNNMGVPLNLSSSFSLLMKGSEIGRLRFVNEVPAHAWSDMPVDINFPWQLLGIPFQQFVSSRSIPEQKIVVKGSIEMGIPIGPTIKKVNVPVEKSIPVSFR